MRLPCWTSHFVVYCAAACALLVPACDSGSNRTATPARKATVDKSSKMQAKRKKLIENLISEEVFLKVACPGSAPQAWTGRKWATLTYDQKSQFVSVVYAYYYDGSDEIAFVRIVDGMTGKNLGTYSIAEGGLKLD